MRRDIVAVALGLGMLGMGPTVASTTYVLSDDDERRPEPKGRRAPRISPTTSREPVKAHKHAREIARRLRQQARAEAKRKARGESEGFSVEGGLS